MKLLLLTVMTFALFAAACGDGSSSKVREPQTVETRAFSLRFSASSGGEALSCDKTLLDLGTGKARAKLLDLAFFIHDLQFVRKDGSRVAAVLATNEWQAENVALLDFQDRSDNCSGAQKPTNALVTGTVVDMDSFVSVEFTLGIPPALNHVDPSSVKAPLNAANMFWSWQSGYKALRLDLSPEGGISRPSDPNFLGTNFFLHLGSTDCSGDPIGGEAVTCAQINQPQIKLPLENFSFDTSEINLDVAALVSKLDINIDNADSPGCMSSQIDSECAGFFDRLGLDLSSGQNTVGQTQAVFSIKSKTE